MTSPAPPPDGGRVPPGRWQRAGRALALERNVVAVAGAMCLVTSGEELWKRYLPKYLEALGAPVLGVGLYGSMRDALDGLCQYPGGWIADRFGRRGALAAFAGCALGGYVLLAAAPAWPVALLGMALAMAWTSMASPTLFAVIGDALPRAQRAMGFSVQAILRRVPIAIAPTLGGLLIAAHGTLQGVRLGLAVSLGVGSLALAVVSRLRLTLPPAQGTANVQTVWREQPQPLRRLLASDILVRTCEGLVDVFLILYALDVVGITAPQFGLLVAVQTTTSILCYLPAARLAGRTGRKPLVLLTFLAFAGFPVAVAASRSFAALAAAYVVGGLREFGEPMRKAMIVDLARPDLRARTVGLYYLTRSVAIAPAAFAGGLLWRISPAVPFLAAGAVGLAGAAVFALTVSERDAG